VLRAQRPRNRLEQLGHPEVAHLERELIIAALDRQQIARLEAAVQHAVALRLGQRGKGLADGHEHASQGRRLGRHGLRERQALEPLAAQEGPAGFVDAVLVHARDMRVVELHRRLRLAGEAAHHVGIGAVLLVQDLERHGHTVRAAQRPVDLADRAVADQRLHIEAARHALPAQVLCGRGGGRRGHAFCAGSVARLLPRYLFCRAHAHLAAVAGGASRGRARRHAAPYRKCERAYRIRPVLA
jgi:hypothetical protein